LIIFRHQTNKSIPGFSGVFDMRRNIFLFPLCLFLLTISAFANSAEEFARQVVSENKKESEIAIDALRQIGQSGLDELFKVYAGEIKQFSETGKSVESWTRIATAIDGVAMQKDAYASGLYWFTDLEEAKKAAKSANKPILSLRLLGNLNEEFSCANSRFFRSILYSNAEIARNLRENYILHWKSVRPAPRITIDFGDGRKIERTITGNSIHYILDENSRILDALPGLYSPQEFAKYLNLTKNLHQSVQKRPIYLGEFQAMRRWQLLNKWKSDLQRTGVKMSESELPKTSGNSSKTENPTALTAAPRAATKMIVELPLVKTLALDESAMAENTKLEDWKKLADLFGKTAIEKESVNFIRRQTANNSDLNNRTFSQMIANLENYVAIDTVRNEYLFHTKIYEWLAENPSADLEKFNEKVYTELFLTPRSDEWLGLYSSDIYSALDGNGIIK